MNEHHRHASVGVAQVLLDGLSAADRAEVQAEAKSKGVSPLEIVRRSLDILISEAGPAAARGRIVGKPAR